MQNGVFFRGAAGDVAVFEIHEEPLVKAAEVQKRRRAEKHKAARGVCDCKRLILRHIEHTVFGHGLVFFVALVEPVGAEVAHGRVALAELLDAAVFKTDLRRQQPHILVGVGKIAQCGDRVVLEQYIGVDHHMVFRLQKRNHLVVSGAEAGVFPAFNHHDRRKLRFDIGRRAVGGGVVDHIEGKRHALRHRQHAFDRCGDLVFVVIGHNAAGYGIIFHIFPLICRTKFCL